MAPVQSDSSEKREFTGPGVRVRVLASGADTDNGWSLFDYSAEAGFQGPEPHWHDEMIEGFYILEGAVNFEIDGEDQRGGPGDYVIVPRHTVHTFSLDPGESARFLVWGAPGGFEGYFEDLEELIAAEDEWPPADMAPVLELMNRYDTYTPPAPTAN